MHKSVTTFLFIVLISLPAAAFAEQALVPQSGQTICYDAAGAEIPCAGTGQDGDQQMGIPWPSPRFSDNSNGTITDNLTGLIWLKNANCFGDIFSLSNALSAANTLASGSCGLSDSSLAGDWRLPNRKELESLINRQQINQATWLNSTGFSNVAADGNDYPAGYWSSSTYNNGTSWKIFFPAGIVGVSNYYGWVWPVRGGQ